MLVLCIILLIIAGILLIPIGADIGYEGGELKVSAKVCGLALTLLPKSPEAENKPKKEKTPKRIKKKKMKKQPEEPQEQKPKKKKKLDIRAEDILALLKTVLGGFGKFGRKFKVDRFLLRYTAAGPDPCDTAVNFAYVNTALSSLAPVCKKRFHVKDCQVSTQIDFLAEKMTLDFGIALSIRIGQILGTVFSILFGALWIVIKILCRSLISKLKNRNNKDGGSSPETGEDTEKVIETENIQAEERMESNG